MGEKSAFAVDHSAHHNPGLSLKSSALSILLLLLCSDPLMSEFEFLQKCRWFMWEVIPGGTLGRGQSGGEGEKPERLNQRVHGFCPVGDHLKKCVGCAGNHPTLCLAAAGELGAGSGDTGQGIQGIRLIPGSNSFL